MNERIKELAEQTTQKFSRFGVRDSWEKVVHRTDPQRMLHLNDQSCIQTRSIRRLEKLSSRSNCHVPFTRTE